MGTKRDLTCTNCEGTGWEYESTGCNDPECCGGPYQVRCLQCDNDWEPGDDDVSQ